MNIYVYELRNSEKPEDVYAPICFSEPPTPEQRLEIQKSFMKDEGIDRGFLKERLIQVRLDDIQSSKNPAIVI